MSLRRSLGFHMPLFVSYFVPADIYEVYFTLAFAGAVTRFRRRMGGMNVGWDIAGYITTADLVRQLEVVTDKSGCVIHFERGTFVERFVGSDPGEPPNGVIAITSDERVGLLERLYAHQQGHRCLYGGPLGPEVGIGIDGVTRRHEAGSTEEMPTDWNYAYYETNEGTIMLAPHDGDRHELSLEGCRTVWFPDPKKEGRVSRAVCTREEPWGAKANIVLYDGIPHQDALKWLAETTKANVEELEGIFREAHDSERCIYLMDQGGTQHAVRVVRPAQDAHELTIIEDGCPQVLRMTDLFLAVDAASAARAPLSLLKTRLSAESVAKLKVLFWGDG